MGVNEFGGDIVGRNKILVTLKGSKELNDEKKRRKNYKKCHNDS